MNNMKPLPRATRTFATLCVSALFDHHGWVRPAWYAFRLLSQLVGPRYAVTGESGAIRALAGDGDGYKHLIVWRYEEGGSDEVE